eukprot:1152411-Pelagomonas_calceolata.AAC.1
MQRSETASSNACITVYDGSSKCCYLSSTYGVGNSSTVWLNKIFACSKRAVETCSDICLPFWIRRLSVCAAHVLQSGTLSMRVGLDWLVVADTAQLFLVGAGLWIIVAKFQAEKVTQP